MKRQILSLATAMALTAGGAIFAQSTLNTPAPGPSQETKPGQTNNNLQNPGSNMQKPATTGTTTTTTTTTPPADTTTGTTGTTGTTNNDTTGTMNNDQTGTSSTTGSTGTMNNDQTGTGSTTGTYNSNSGSTTGSSMDNTSTSSTTTSTRRLPKTASDLPTVALMGLLALSAFFAVRVYAKRNA
ncbi:MAG TPA: hypothetical protein VIA62_22870 [Thermoanaerobaculia bacterium]|jgi:cobalamin biosynthesis Mg chelatase CobN|nr:hypothetical protein [Thermoanaerobaculia bacterium]